MPTPIFTDGPDQFQGGAAAETLSGLGGSDEISGGGGADLIYGGDGADILRSDAPFAQVSFTADSLYGGAGDDWIEATTPNASIDGGTGTDYLQAIFRYLTAASLEVDLVGNLWRLNGAALSVTSIERVNLTLWGGGLHSTVSGGALDDWIVADSSFDAGIGWMEARGLGGADRMTLNGTNGRLYGGDGNDVLTLNSYGGAVDVVLDGGAGADQLDASRAKPGPTGASHLSLYGGAGDDVIFSQVWADLDAGSGTDSVWLFGGDLSGRILAVDLPGGSLTDAGVRHDFLGVEALDLSEQGAALSVTGGGLGDHVRMQDGSGSVFGAGGNDSLEAHGAVAASLYGGAGNDILTGGNDTTSAGSYDLLLDGGDGLDRFTLWGEGSATVRGGADADSVTWAGADGLIDTGSGNDTITAHDSAVAILGGDGDDLIGTDGTTGSVDAGAGTDRVSATTAHLAPTYAGGAGEDWLTLTPVPYDATAGRVVALAGADGLAVTVGAGQTLVTGFETVELSGGAKRDVMRGGAEADVFYGESLQTLGGAADRLYGGAGEDSLGGGAGNDSLWGGAGNDVLAGGLGTDWMRGGAGADHFLFSDPRGLGMGATQDVIADFQHGIDKLDFILPDYDLPHAYGEVGDSGLVYRGGKLFDGLAAEVRWTYAGGNTQIRIDANGDGKADLSILLIGKIALTAGDFLL